MIGTGIVFVIYVSVSIAIIIEALAMLKIVIIVAIVEVVVAIVSGLFATIVIESTSRRLRVVIVDRVTDRLLIRRVGWRQLRFG